MLMGPSRTQTGTFCRAQEPSNKNALRHIGRQREGNGPRYPDEASFTRDAHQHFRGNVAPVGRPA
jgi:hypothetical protein